MKLNSFFKLLVVISLSSAVSVWAAQIGGNCQWQSLSTTGLPQGQINHKIKTQIIPAVLKVFSPNDIWLGGCLGISVYENDPPTSGTFSCDPALFHFDGKTWSEKKIPTDLYRDEKRLLAQKLVMRLGGRSSEDLYVGVMQGGDDDGLYLHWNGSTFEKPSVALPAPRGIVGILAVEDETWFIGNESRGVGTFFAPQLLNPVSYKLKNGHLGKFESAFRTRADFKDLDIGMYNSVVALAPNDIWAVGGGSYWIQGTTSYDNSSIIEHFDGIRWSVVRSPQISKDIGKLYYIAAAKDGKLLVTGKESLLQYDGANWKVSKLPTSLVHAPWDMFPDLLKAGSLEGGRWQIIGVDRNPLYSLPGNTSDLYAAWLMEKGWFSESKLPAEQRVTPVNGKYEVDTCSPWRFSATDIGGAIAVVAGSRSECDSNGKLLKMDVIPFVQQFVCK